MRKRKFKKHVAYRRSCGVARKAAQSVGIIARKLCEGIAIVARTWSNPRREEV